MIRGIADKARLERVSFTVAAGEVYCLLGGPGSGKTTSIDLALGLLRPTSGEVRLLGGDPVLHNPMELRRQVSYVAASSLYPSQSALDNLALLVRLGGAKQQVREQDELNALRRFGAR